jgi:hypothetical protein
VTTILQKPLFSWEDVDGSSDLRRLQLVLEYLPDESVVAGLERERGARGRNTYPVRPVWNAVLAGVVLQHPTVESLLRDLRRNAELRQVCGFNPLLGSAAVPSSFAMSRFLANLVEHADLVNDMFDELVDQLRALLPDLGQHLGFDGKAIPSFSTGRKSRESGQTSDPDADWGVKTYRGVGAGGKPWEKVTRWFGYQLHLICDTTLEVPVAFEVMPASSSEVTRLLPMVERLAARHPKLKERCTDLSADRGLDSGPVNKALWEDCGVKPVVDVRRLWKNEKSEQGFDASREITRALNPDVADTVVYTERGEVRCVCPLTDTERRMAFWGFEEDRDTLRYRCPAAAYDLECKGRAQCEQGALGRETSFGRVVRVNLDLDRRIFTPVPRDTPSWRRLYASRTAVERVNARVDQVFGFERHTIRGLDKMRLRVGLALAVMLALAVGSVAENQPELMRSLVGRPRAQARAA